MLVGPSVLEAVARAFEASEGSPRNLGDRLVEGIAAGRAAGGDARKGRPQSAAVVVADSRPGISRRPDGLTVNIHVGEHAQPVEALRRIYDTVSQTLGFRTLEQHTGADVWQLKVILHALGYFGDPATELARGGDAFAAAGSPAGLVDGETVARLWAELEKTGKANAIREQLREVTRIRR